MSTPEMSSAILQDVSIKSEEFERVVREWLPRWKDASAEARRVVEGDLLQRLVSSGPTGILCSSIFIGYAGKPIQNAQAKPEEPTLRPAI